MIKPTIIAEIGCNHKGDINIAKEFIKTAHDFCKVNIVKFQKRTVNEILTPEEYNSPHPNPVHAYGKTYGEHRKYLENSIEEHRELKNFCEDLGMTYTCSVWDMISTKEIVALNPALIKIPSATNTNFDMLGYICAHYHGQIHVSLGMTTKKEEQMIVDFFEKHNRTKDLVLYACTSGYPVPPEDICLLEISRLVKTYGDCINAVGFSGHHNGISLDIAAYTLGAIYIERHFTLDRTWKGTDHAASLEPDGLRRLNRDLINAHKALTYKNSDLLDIEIDQRNKLKWDRHTINIDKTIVTEKSNHKSTLSKLNLLLIDVDGVLTDAGMYYTESGDELKKFNTRDAQGIELLRKIGVKVGIITRENTKIVEKRAKKMNVDFIYQGITDKLAILKQLCQLMNINPENIGYVGDDIHDIDSLNYVGFSAVPKDAINQCKGIASYICSKKGGEGCVREVAELILSQKASEK